MAEKTKQVGIRLPDELYEKLAQLAESQHRTLSGMVRAILEERFANN